MENDNVRFKTDERNTDFVDFKNVKKSKLVSFLRFVLFVFGLVSLTFGILPFYGFFESIQSGGWGNLAIFSFFGVVLVGVPYINLSILLFISALHSKFLFGQSRGWVITWLLVFLVLIVLPFLLAGDIY